VAPISTPVGSSFPRFRFASRARTRNKFNASSRCAHRSAPSRLIAAEKGGAIRTHARPLGACARPSSRCAPGCDWRRPINDHLDICSYAVQTRSYEQYNLRPLTTVPAYVIRTVDESPIAEVFYCSPSANFAFNNTCGGNRVSSAVH
jgi:hypothetical protein